MCHLEKASQQLRQQKILYLWWRCIHVVYTETNQSLSVWMHTEYKVEKNSKSKRKQTKKESIICRYEMPGNTRYLEFNCCGGNCMSVSEKVIDERTNKRLSEWMNEWIRRRDELSLEMDVQSFKFTCLTASLCFSPSISSISAMTANFYWIHFQFIDVPFLFIALFWTCKFVCNSRICSSLVYFNLTVFQMSRHNGNYCLFIYT